MKHSNTLKFLNRVNYCFFYFEIEQIIRFPFTFCIEKSSALENKRRDIEHNTYLPNVHDIVYEVVETRKIKHNPMRNVYVL